MCKVVTVGRSTHMNSMEDSIRKLCVELRDALDHVQESTWRSVTVDSFPRGACGHCAELLAEYLKRKLGIHVTYASGRVGHLVPNADYHAWLEFEGLAIDISADQFGLPPVIVSRDSDLHLRADEVNRHPIFTDHWWPVYAKPVWDEAMEIIRQAEG